MPTPRKDLDEKDWAHLIGMIRIQCTQEEICGVLGMSAMHLNKKIKERGEEGVTNFAELRDKHGAEGKAAIRRAQFKAATEEGNPTMLVWLGKQYLHQTDMQVRRLAGHDGGAIKTESTVLDEVKLKDVSTGALKELRGALIEAVLDDETMH